MQNQWCTTEFLSRIRSVLIIARHREKDETEQLLGHALFVGLKLKLQNKIFVTESAGKSNSRKGFCCAINVSL